MMALVARTFSVMPLVQAAEALERSCLPPRALAITFDDGYANNHDIAMPILQRHSLTATFFIATGFLDGGRMWNDTVIECLRRSARDNVDLETLGLATVSLQSAAARRQAIEQVIKIIKYTRPESREPLLSALHLACGSPQLPQDLMMSSAQVLAMKRGGMGVGAHTINHPILRTLSASEAEQEMRGSRVRLQQMMDDPIHTFAYPNGQPGTDYDEGHVALARNLGFKTAVSTASGVSRPGDDMFQLKRFTPWQPNPARWLASLAAHHARN